MSESNQDENIHQISDATLDLGKKHADVSIKHGKSVENIGIGLQLEGEERGKSIEQHGKAMQRHARVSKAYLEAGEQQQGEAANISHNLSVEEHVKQTQRHIQATREYGKILEDRRKEIQVAINSNQEILSSKNSKNVK